ncbi:Ribosome-binding factor [Trichinella pseudospiralis]
MEQPLKDDVVSKVEDTLNHLIEEVTELLDNEDSLNKENVSMQNCIRRNRTCQGEHLEKQVNLMYEYVGVWKVEGFLIPDLKPNDLVTVLRNLPDPKKEMITLAKIRMFYLMKSLCHEKIYQSVINDSSENEISRQTCTLCTSYQCCFRCSDELMQHRENALSSTKLSTNGNASVISNIVNDLVIYKYVKELSNWISDKKDVQCSLDKDSRSILKIPAPKRSGGSARPEEVENNKNSKQRKESLMKIRLGLLQRCQKSASESETSSSLKKSTKKSSRKLSLITSEENSSS